MKKSVLFLAVFLLAFSFMPLFAHSGIMWGEKEIRYVSTKYFDIIYENDSAESAALLFENADNILKEVQDFFGAGELDIRIPVVISSNNQIYNALCANITYTYINMYDSVCDEDIAVFSNELLSTFKHELTHAYTLNMKNGFWTGFTKIMGAVYNPSNLFVPSGMAEGATVLSESSLGEGRLNDEWTMQIPRQAKIENKWPGYYDEQGNSTKSPAGDYYIFNACFAEYLKENFGMEKYVEFWYRCANFKTISTALAFKKVYGISIWEAWENYEENLFVPPYTEPFDTKTISDFFSGSFENYSVENDMGAFYQNLSMTEKGLYYLEAKSGNVYFVPKTDLQKNDFQKPGTTKKITPKNLFYKSGITNISASSDGRFIAYDYYDFSKANYKYCSAVYDTKTKKHFSAGEKIKSSSIVKNGDEYYLISLNFESQKTNLSARKFIFQNSKMTGFESPTFIPLARGTAVYSFADAGGGNFAMIIQSGMEWEIVLGSVRAFENYEENSYENSYGENFLKIKMPFEKMTARYLSYSRFDNSLYFSWTVPDSMPRLGKISLDNFEFTLSEENISGGVYYPVNFSDSESHNERLIFIGQFTKQNRIFISENSENPERRIFSNHKNQIVSEPKEKDFSIISDNVITLSKPAEEILIDSKKYNSFKYLSRPLIIPFGFQSDFPLGASLLAVNPWGKGITIFSAGYGWQTNSFSVSATFQDGTETSRFNYALSTAADFDSHGFKSISETYSAKLNFSSVSFFDKGAVSYGRTLSASPENIFYILNNAGITLDFVKPYSSELKSYFGFEWSFELINYYCIQPSSAPEKLIYNNISSSFDFYIPKLIPVKCYDRFSYNLPSVISLSIFPNTTDFLSGTFSSTIFGYDIQKGIPYFFFNRIFIRAGYSITFKYENHRFAQNWELLYFSNDASLLLNGSLPYTDKIFLDVSLLFIPNLGNAKANVNLTTEIFYSPKPLLWKNSWGVKFLANISL